MSEDELVELEIGAPAHGGHTVSRLDGRVVFVRHALPGERVRVRFTDRREQARFWRADAIEVLDASPDRVPSVWPAAGPGGVGGGELAHVALPAQRAWKRAVLREQLTRLAHDDRDVEVLAAPGDDARGGLAYRTRVDLGTDGHGRAGMTVWHSHDVRALDSMPLAVPPIADLELFDRRWPAGATVQVAVGQVAVGPGGDTSGKDGQGAVAPGADERPVVLVDGQVWDLRRQRPDSRPTARRTVREQVRGRTYRVAADGFWQAHREAPAVLVDAVLAGVGDVAGATVADLYSGSGLFTVPLAEAVGPDGAVIAVEGDDRAVRDARRNAHDLPQVTLYSGAVHEVLTGVDELVHTDVVVLDPPRVGAGRAVVEAVVALAPTRIVYVACDPAALGRDLGLLTAAGYRTVDVTGHDLFPMTHHVEAVAVVERA